MNWQLKEIGRRLKTPLRFTSTGTKIETFKFKTPANVCVACLERTHRRWHILTKVRLASHLVIMSFVALAWSLSTCIVKAKDCKNCFSCRSHLESKAYHDSCASQVWGTSKPSSHHPPPITLRSLYHLHMLWICDIAAWPHGLTSFNPYRKFSHSNPNRKADVCTLRLICVGANLIRSLSLDLPQLPHTRFHDVKRRCWKHLDPCTVLRYLTALLRWPLGLRFKGAPPLILFGHVGCKPNTACTLSMTLRVNGHQFSSPGWNGPLKF